MHWILSTTDTFSLRQTIRQSSWLLHAPFRTTHTGDQLLRIERITQNKTVAVVIAQNNHNLVIHSSSNLSGTEIETLTKRARRMLRLGDDFKPFYNLIESNPLPIKGRISPAILRGTTFFEDVIRATSMVWHPDGDCDAQNYVWLVDRFGDPLPSNPTLHAFPSPDQIMGGEQAVITNMTPPMGETILYIADIFQTQAHKVWQVLDENISTTDLTEKIQKLFHIESTSVSQVMLSLGRYDYIPTDPVAVERWRRFWNVTDANRPLDIVEHFQTWQPWGGLAYWLWDWSPVKESSRLY